MGGLLYNNFLINSILKSEQNRKIAINKLQNQFQILKLIMIQQTKQKVEAEHKLQDIRHIKVTVKHQRLINQTVELNPRESLADFKQYLSQSTILYIYENYHFELNGKILPHSSQIDAIIENDSIIDVIIDPFDQRTSKYHIRKIQQLIKNPILWVVINHKDQNIKAKEEESFNQIELNIQQSFEPNFQSKLFHQKKEVVCKDTLFFLNYSGYNPPPTSRKLCGDLFYLHLKTLENQQYHVTANCRGFFINNSTTTIFDFSISNEFNKYFNNFLDLLNEISPKFKSTFKQNAQNICITEIQRISVTSNYKRQNIWLENSKKTDHLWNSNRFQEQYSIQHNGIKDWNQMLQVYNALPSNTLIDKLNRSKMINKIYSQFTVAAIHGAKALVEGRMNPLNPLDEKSQHIYIQNSIFYSVAKQTPYDYEVEKGIEATPTVSAIHTDLRNLGILMNLEINQLHVLHMLLVEYRGFKIIAQCIIPGILSAEQLQCSQYGSIDQGKTIQTNKQFQALMTKVCTQLGIDTNLEFIDGKGEKKKVAGSIEIKGILGSDKRKYILDLMRFSPRDYNYLGEKYQACVLRPQLIAAYKNSKEYHSSQLKNIPINVNLETGIEFVRSEITSKQEQQLRLMAAYLKNTCIPLLIKSLGTTQRKYLSDCKGIMKIFHKYGVNTRYLGYTIKHPSIQDHPQVRVALQRIILVKSIKHFFRMALRQSSPLHLSTVLTRLLNCMFGTRSQKKILEQSSDAQYQNIKNGNNQQSKKKKKKKLKQKEKQKQINKEKALSQQIKQQNKIEEIYIPHNKYLMIKPSQMWAQIIKIAESRYQYKFVDNYNDYFGLDFPFNKIATLRDLCITIGLKIEAKNYLIFQNGHQNNELPFKVQNIIELQAIPKHIPLINKETNLMIQRADFHMSKYQIQEAVDLYQNAIQYMIGLYSGMNEQIAIVYHKIANIYYRLGDFQTAISFQKNNLDLLEMLYGEDHILTIQSYSNLGLYYFAKMQKNKGIYYIFKSIYISNFSFGESYPETIINYLNLSAIYQQCKQYQSAIICIIQTIDKMKKIYGHYNLNTAICYSALAALHFQISDLRQTIEFQEISTSILKKILKENDSRLIESINQLNKYRDLLQNKRIHEENTNNKRSSIIPKDELSNKMTLNNNRSQSNYERSLLVKKIQMAKWNSRMGFKR